MDRAIKRGDLVYLNFDPIIGSEQGGPRPAVVIQNDIGNKHAPTVIIAPVTSKTKKTNLPTHVKLTSKCLERNSMVLLEQIKTIDKSRIESYIGTLSEPQNHKPIFTSLCREHEGSIRKNGKDYSR